MEVAAAAADAGRQLYAYSYGVTVWDHSQETYLSAYLAMLTGLVASGLTWKSWVGPKGEAWGLFTQTGMACLLQGVGYGMAGIAFHIVDTEAYEGTYSGAHAWLATSSWKYPWYIAMLCIPLCSSCLLGVGVVFVGKDESRFTAVKVANGIGGLVALYAVYLAATSEFGSTAPMFYWGLFSCGVATGTVLYLGWGKVGMKWLFAGLSIRLAGFLYVIFGPCSNYLQSCPYPQDATKNMVFTLCIAFSIIPFYYGAVTKSRDDQAYQQLMKAEQAAKLAAADKTRRCCN